MGWDYTEARNGETAFDVLQQEIEEGCDWELSDEVVDGEKVAYGTLTLNGVTSAVVALLDDGEGNNNAGKGMVGYKLMDEMSGPFYYGASAALLEKLSGVTELPYGVETAAAWRLGVSRRLAGGDPGDPYAYRRSVTGREDV